MVKRSKIIMWNTVEFYYFCVWIQTEIDRLIEVISSNDSVLQLRWRLYRLINITGIFKIFTRFSCCDLRTLKLNYTRSRLPPIYRSTCLCCIFCFGFRGFVFTHVLVNVRSIRAQEFDSLKGEGGHTKNRLTG